MAIIQDNLGQNTLGVDSSGAASVKVMNSPTVSFNNDDFSFPKPPNLVEFLIDQICDKDDIILDSFAGSGTTAIGVEIGRTVVLVEKNLNEFEKLKERWEEKIIKTD